MTTKTESTAKKTADAGKHAFDMFADWFSVPSFDAKGVFEFQRKNMEAAVEANKLVFEGMKTVTQKNIDLAKDGFADLNDLTTSAMTSKTPENSFAKSSEFAQTMFQKNVKATREASDVLVDAGQKAVTVLQERFTEGTKELRSAAAK